MGFVLGLLQFAMKEDLVSVIERGLRVVVAVAGQQAGQEQNGRQADYYPGPCAPFAVAVAPNTVPPPMHPRCMFSMCRVK
jgi:hypothetical protein